GSLPRGAALRARSSRPCVLTPTSLGSTSSTSVPSPGADRISAVPPSLLSRPRTESRSPRRSSGTVSGSKPLPRSRTNTCTLPAGQPVHRLRVVRVPLDEREGLQHRVVQVRGDGGPLLRADAGGALGLAGVQQPPPQRCGGQDDADQDHQGGGKPVAGVGQLP